MRKYFIACLMTVFLGIVSINAHATAIYEWVCDDANCNGDSDFTSTMTISESAFTAGGFTGISGNLLNWTTTSGVGVGYTLTLPNMLNASSGTTADQSHVKIVLSADGSEVSELWDVSDGTNITFFDSEIGRVDFFEGSTYSVGSLQDATMFNDRVFSDILIDGRFKRVAPVPEPSTILLLGGGLAGLALYRRKRK